MKKGRKGETKEYRRKEGTKVKWNKGNSECLNRGKVEG